LFIKLYNKFKMHKHDDTKDENTNNNILGGFDFSAIEELDPSLSINKRNLHKK